MNITVDDRLDPLWAVVLEHFPELSGSPVTLLAELRRLERTVMEAAGANTIAPWLPAEEILRRVWPALPSHLRGFATATITAWQELPPDPHGTTYGFFDGHGWNMAFDHARGRLNGVYDFGDSGFGAVHQDFIYSNFISRDLTLRIVGEYEALTGRALDRQRIDTLTGVLRLFDLAEIPADDDRLPTIRQFLVDWVAALPHGPD